MINMKNKKLWEVLIPVILAVVVVSGFACPSVGHQLAPITSSERYGHISFTSCKRICNQRPYN